MNLYDIEVAKKHLDFNASNGTFSWKARARSEFKNEQAYKAWHTKCLGKNVGTKFTNSSGKTYIQIVIKGHSYMVHRLSYMFFHGCLPDGIIDHFDGDGENNKPSNLRDVSYSKNSRNMRKSTRNTSGVVGVSWSKQRRKWHARVCCERVVRHLGFFNSVTDAEVAINEARKKLGFTSAHGHHRDL